MFKVGLTGGIGSGKSTIASFFEELGIEVIDADLIAKQITKSNQPAFKHIVQHFGESILSSDGEIDRKKMRKQIFSNATKKNWLENLLHPLILKEMEDKATQSKSPYCILMIPLIKEVEASHRIIDRILVVDAPIYLQIERIQKRDHISKKEAKKIIAAQSSRKERLLIANDVILNNKDKSHIKSEVEHLHQDYLKMSLNA